MWSLPTRNRPHNLKRFIDAYIKTKGSSKVYVRLDIDDPSLDEYLQLDFPETFEVVQGPREGLKAAMEEMFHKYPDEEWYGLGADDIVPRTDYWDKYLAEEAGLCKIAHPDDLGKKKKKYLPTHPVCGGDLVRAVGWFGHPATKHFFLDNSWQYIGEELECITLREDIVVEHVHHSTGKAPLDETYNQVNSNMESDRKLYNEWISNYGIQLINDLKDKGF